ncbi:transposase [Streptomyces endocoffeicus]|uniref:transposase n=1 Tax=Streptomyces endocoffeicus TaxID=2898945 RepID=UPI003558B92B
MILDSQSVKGAETVGQDSRGFDGGKLINGRKRHLSVDMRGMPLAVMPRHHPQDRAPPQRPGRIRRPRQTVASGTGYLVDHESPQKRP